MIPFGLQFLLLLVIRPYGQAAEEPVVEVRLQRGRFVPGSIHVPKRGRLKLVNLDTVPYTIEGAGALPGDVIIPPNESRTVTLMPLPGKFYVVIEEIPASELRLDMEGDPEFAAQHRGIPFDAARQIGRQPLLFEPGYEPGYATYTAFNIAGKGEDSQQGVLRELYLIQEALAGEAPPEEFRLFFTQSDWQSFRQSISMIYALGPGSYSGERFGPRIAACRPADLRPISYVKDLKIKATGQRDVLVRVASDRQWFNQRAVRWIWQRLKNRIANSTMEIGYANPNGRSPILGGFFDGTGNAYGPEREAGVFGPLHENGTYLAWFRINFDEERFRSRPLADQQRLIGRQREIGKPLPNASPAAHMNRAGADPKTAILRQPFIFDEGPGRTGLLFASLQFTPRAVEKILHGFMLGSPNPKQKRPHDLFLDYMKFESAALYYVPSSPQGSFPGSLRFGGR